MVNLHDRRCHKGLDRSEHMYLTVVTMFSFEQEQCALWIARDFREVQKNVVGKMRQTGWVSDRLQKPCQRLDRLMTGGGRIGLGRCGGYHHRATLRYMTVLSCLVKCSTYET